MRGRYEFRACDAAIRYCKYLSATHSGGLCIGQSWVWLSELIAGAATTLMPPNVFMVVQVQREYEAGNQEAIHYFNRKVSELKSRAAGKCLQQLNAADSITSVALVNALVNECHGNTAIMMCWGINQRKSKLDKAFGHYDSTRAMALFKLKHSNKIYFFDPNHGVYQWAQTPGVELKRDIKLFMLQSPARARVAIYSAVRVSTEHDVSPSVMQ